MPTVLRVDGYRFYFYSMDCEEPRHVHIEKGGAQAKYWLEPVRLHTCNRRFTTADARKVERIIYDNFAKLQSGWDEHCSG